MMRKLSTCLADLGITDPSAFASSDGVDEEFKIIKRAYQRKILKDHPVSIIADFHSWHHRHWFR